MKIGSRPNRPTSSAPASARTGTWPSTIRRSPIFSTPCSSRWFGSTQPAAPSSSMTAASHKLADVPTHAYTLTIPALLAAPVVSVVVPGPRKANAVLTTLRGPISESCPATALRRHAGAKLYLDRDSARLVM